MKGIGADNSNWYRVKIETAQCISHEGDAVNVIEFTVIGDWEIRGIIGAFKGSSLGFPISGKEKEIEISEETLDDWTELSHFRKTSSASKPFDESDIPF